MGIDHQEPFQVGKRRLTILLLVEAGAHLSIKGLHLLNPLKGQGVARVHGENALVQGIGILHIWRLCADVVDGRIRQNVMLIDKRIAVFRLP